MKKKRKNTVDRILGRIGHHGEYMLLVALTVVIMCMAAFRQSQAQNEDSAAAKERKEALTSNSFQVPAHEGSEQILVCDTGKADRDERLIIELEPNSSPEEWKIVHDAIERCGNIDLTIWYDFGSLKLKMQPEGALCRMDLWMEGELTENERPQRYTCIGDPAVLKQLNLVFNGKSLREMPPSELPEALKPFCKAYP